MLTFNKEKGNCTGCSACYSVCPKHCITMKEDKEGFLYPEANDECVHCGLCEKVCPAFKNKVDLKFKQQVIAAVSKDYDIWNRSASGGAFSEICKQWADDTTLIVGAAWDGFRVHHVGVVGYDNIAPLCKSKYLSSAIEDTFIEIKKHLDLGYKVIFCGCPCQVAGLQGYLHKDFENLLTIDLICHGQGSPKVFKACIENMEKTVGLAIKGYQFRAKRKRYEVDYLACLETEKKNIYVVKDPYIQLFLSQNALRPSCGKNCKYRDSRRPGDITIADLKGLAILFPDLQYTEKNWSTIVSNTAKGEKCVQHLSRSMEIRPISIADVIKYNPLFARQTWFSKDRDAFFADFEANADAAISKWTVPATEHKPYFVKQMYSALPGWLKKIISKTLQLIRKER